MNTRRNIDYGQMYQAIDDVMNQKLPQMQLYCAIGSIVCIRSEKGAAVMASEYIRAKYPEVQGFSPRNLRRMRYFCRTYEKHSTLLLLAMELGWTQNVVIMEANLTMELREWYLRAARQFGWSKTELIARIAAEAHMATLLGALYARKMVSDHLADKCRKDFYDRLAQEKELHLSVCISMISEDAVRVRSQVKAVQKESNIVWWMGNEHVSQLLSMAWI